MIQQTTDLCTTVDHIVQQLDLGTNELPEEAILQARMNRDAIIPRLIQTIQSAAERSEAGNIPAGNAHFFALFLLTEFRAKEALPAIISAISLPGELAHDLFGDAVTETLPRILAELAGDNPEVIADLILNRTANEYVRGSAACTYLHYVRDGRLSRDEAIDILRCHLREAIANKDVEITDGLVGALADYSPQEAFGDIQIAFELGLVDDEVINLEDVRRSISEGEAEFRKAISYCGPTGIQDTLEELKGWSAFSDERDSTTEPEILEEDFHYDPTPIPSEPTHSTFRHTGHRIGRNDPCPCDSGRKYKKCCGKL